MPPRGAQKGWGVRCSEGPQRRPPARRAAASRTGEQFDSRWCYTGCRGRVSARKQVIATCSRRAGGAGWVGVSLEPLHCPRKQAGSARRGSQGPRTRSSHARRLPAASPCSCPPRPTAAPVSSQPGRVLRRLSQGQQHLADNVHQRAPARQVAVHQPHNLVRGGAQQDARRSWPPPLDLRGRTPGGGQRGA